MAGYLITLEGPEGAGKSTLIPKLAERLSASGREVVSTREPGATDLGKQIRRLLLEGDDMSGTTELFLFLADRSHHVNQLIRPTIARGGIVLCDRFTDSTVVYQSVARGGDRQVIRQLNGIATGGLVPDLTLLLDLRPELGLSRATKGDRLDREPLAFHQAVAGGYLELAGQEPDRIKIVDASQPMDAVFDQAWGYLSTFLDEKA